MRLRKRIAAQTKAASDAVAEHHGEPPRARRSRTPLHVARRSRDDAGLSPQERRFVEHYMHSLNASTSAVKAGYSERSAGVIGHELLTRPKVVAEIQRKQAALAEKFDYSRERLLTEAAKVAFANVKDFMTITGDGSPVFDFSTMTAEQWAAIGEVTVEEFKDGRSDQREVRRIKVKKDAKLAAIELMARLQGFMTADINVKHDHHHTVLHTMLQEIDAEARAAKTIEHEPPTDPKKPIDGG